MESRDPNEGFLVPAGKDRFNNNDLKIWGLIPLATKLSAEDTGGALFVFEHRNMAKGGPPRHVHHKQDEWFYVVQGEFAVEVGENKYRLKPGDSMFAPREVPHAWTQISNEPGTMLTIASPAGTFETFMRDTTKHQSIPSQADIAKAFAAHDMTVVGPPLAVD
ncbi:MAG TPA: cupin domain-containing protein [Lacipirellulaceae bacterium]|jgi:mannose-6-phosphate isomerase-like protein (cupin superfamily)|nr:cupin domain-containing protein [Lacipirellulaceae bacterium]